VPGPDEVKIAVPQEVLAPLLTKASSEMASQLGVDKLDPEVELALHAKVGEAIQRRLDDSFDKVVAGVARWPRRSPASCRPSGSLPD
jgi:hypothetical protein